MPTTRVPLSDLALPHWTKQERANAELITDFVQHLMNDHDFDYVERTFGAHRYLQHNLTIPDGVAGVLKTVRDVVARYPDYQYDVKAIFSTGDMVIFHSHVTTSEAHRGDGNKGLIITDRWQVVDGELVEHWDAIQPIHGLFRFVTWLTGGAIRNHNSRF